MPDSIRPLRPAPPAVQHARRLATDPAAPRSQQVLAWLILKSARGQTVSQSGLHRLRRQPGTA